MKDLTIMDLLKLSEHYITLGNHTSVVIEMTFIKKYYECRWWQFREKKRLIKWRDTELALLLKRNP